MSDLLSPADIEDLAGKAGLSMAEVCRRAGIAQSTFTRWKAGKTEPTLDAYRKLCDVVRPDRVAAAPKVPADYPLPDQVLTTQANAMHERPSPFRFAPTAAATRGSVPFTGDDAQEAWQILARINRDLTAEEARADRLLRLYNL